MNRMWIVVVALGAAGVSWAGESKPTIADLSWLAGCWEGGGETRSVREQWTRPAGGAMLGVSHTVAGGKMVAYEFIRLHEEADGIYYSAHPSGQAPNSFKLVKVGKGEAIFEDPEHDFPQRVIYRLGADGALAASIEGTVDGKQKVVEFPMRRATCP